MKKSVKRASSIVLTLCFVIALLPVAASAATELTELWVGDVQVVGGASPVTSGDGWSYAEGVLTLDGYSYEGAGHENAAIYAAGDLTITLDGASSVTHSDNNNDSGGSYGIRVENGELIINGSGILSAAAGTVTAIYESSYGISITGLEHDNDITISGVTVFAAGGSATENTSSSYGIFSLYGNVCIEGADTVVAAVGGAAASHSCGIKGVAVFIQDGARVTAGGGTVVASGSHAFSSGIESINKGVSISGENTVVTATGGKATGVNKNSYSYGLEARGGATIDAAMLTATAGSVSGTIDDGIYRSSRGIYVIDISPSPSKTTPLLSLAAVRR